MIQHILSLLNTVHSRQKGKDESLYTSKKKERAGNIISYWVGYLHDFQRKWQQAEWEKKKKKQDQ